MNQHSYSNAEIFSHAIKTTGRGKLVGTRDARRRDLDGRPHADRRVVHPHPVPRVVPARRDGHGAQRRRARHRDPQLPADEAAGLDPQLKVAVEDLLGRLERGER
jgi:hypothetical protein